eukprot:403374877
MSLKSVVQLLFLGAITLQQATATKWVQIWNDEFDGSQIDTSKWGHDQGNWGWGNNELENYTDRPENSYVQDGNLVIQANQENLGGSQYTSARMTTQGKFSTLYGKVEARAKLPHGQGIWAAFWLLGEKYEWPMNGSIDIMEFIGKDPENTYGKLQGPNFNSNATYHLDGGFHSDFHVYGVEWQPEQLDFYVDGNIFHTVHKSEQKDFWPFSDHKFFIILDLAVGGDWPGVPDQTTHFPQKFVIDYVRVYQADNSSNSQVKSDSHHHHHEKNNEQFLN